MAVSMGMHIRTFLAFKAPPERQQAHQVLGRMAAPNALRSALNVEVHVCQMESKHELVCCWSTTIRGCNP
jgi:hypothetical protein